MSNIRKQAIISSLLLYVGFAIGALNIYLFTKNGSFTESEFGLTRLFFDFGQNIAAFATLGATSVMAKFYPYYQDNLDASKNDLPGLVLLTVLFGFIVVSLAGVFLQPLVMRKYSAGSKLFVDYYFWVYPFGLGILLFSVFETLCYINQKAIVPNFLRETVLRVFTTILIVLFYLKYIGFDTFIKLFSFLYLAIFCIIGYYVYQSTRLKIIFSISNVTKKFYKKMLVMQVTLFGGNIINVLGQTVDGLLIGSLINIKAAAIFTLSQYLANLVQIPQRSLQNLTIGPISMAWKHKNTEEISRIYSRSCSNMLLASMFIFGNVVLCAEDGIHLFNLQLSYLDGIPPMIILGIMRILDAGTGVNGIVIITSSYWRFDFISGIVMIVLIIPANYLLIRHFGIIGSAYAQLISYFIYNFIRFEFIRRKFSMQPFSLSTLFSIIIACLAFFVSKFFGGYFSLLWGIIFKISCFSLIMIVSTISFGLSVDATQLWNKFVRKC